MMKDNTVYNSADNQIYVKTNGDLIYIICNKESQQDTVIERMVKLTALYCFPFPFIVDKYQQSKKSS